MEVQTWRQIEFFSSWTIMAYRTPWRSICAMGYEVAAFDNGSAATGRLAKGHSFGLAPPDIMLPGVDGFALFEHMQRYGIPVVYMTAKTDSESEVKGLRDGAEDYIVRSFEVIRLKRYWHRTAEQNLPLRRYFGGHGQPHHDQRRRTRGVAADGV